MKTWLPKSATIRWLFVPALTFICMMASYGYLTDFWHHLARGRAIVEDRQLLNEDRFTYTVAGTQFQDVNWLTQILYFHLYEIGGLDLVSAVNALTLALTLGLLVAMSCRLSGSLPVSVGIGIFVFIGLWQVLTIRPQTFSFLFFVVVYILLDRSEQRPLLLVAIPPIIGLWANMHGAFPAGMMLVGCFGLASAWRGWRQNKLFTHPATWRLAFCLLACVLATLINPYTWHIYEYVGLTSNRALNRRIDEWVPPSFHLLIGKMWVLSLTGMASLFVLTWHYKRPMPSARNFVLLGVFFLLAVGSVRMVAWWLLIVAPIASVMIVHLWPKLVPQSEEPGTLANAVLLVAIAVAVVLSVPQFHRYNPLLWAKLGSRTENDLESVYARLTDYHDSGRIFSRFEWGEYLGWSFSPDFKVFMDGRIEIYPDKVWDEYSTVTRGKKDWQTILDDYQVDAMILDADYHKRTGLLPKVQASPRWQLVDRSRDVLLFLRSDQVAALEN